MPHRKSSVHVAHKLSAAVNNVSAKLMIHKLIITEYKCLGLSLKIADNELRIYRQELWNQTVERRKGQSSWKRTNGRNI